MDWLIEQGMVEDRDGALFETATGEPLYPSARMPAADDQPDLS